VFAASNIGTLAAATPLAWIAATVGWRSGFLGLAAITLLVAVGFLVFVRDRPPEYRGPEPTRESPGKILRGLWEVWRTPGLGPVLSMHFFAYATMLTVLGVWGGPYLYDVHKLDGVARGNVLLAMGVAQILGILAYGPMDRVLRSRKRVVFGGAAISMVLLATLAALAHPPLWLAVSLLIAFCFFCAYGTVIVAQGRALFPDRLAGRGVTTVNMAQCLGLAVLPAAAGYIVEGFGAGDTAYRWVFGTLAAGLVLGSFAYVRARDSFTARG
jgi:predicted MFS family arabinose efflux permease